MTPAPDTGRTAEEMREVRYLRAVIGTLRQELVTERKLVKGFEAEAAQLRSRLLQAEKGGEAMRARLLIAFHDAIRRPLGVTPDSGAEFYDPRMADEAEERRRLARAGGRHAYQPHKLYPHFCAQCGYPEHEALMHLPAASGGSDQKGGDSAA